MLLISAASIAILTTVGIVLSLVFNTIEFFRLYPASEFFSGLEWAPSFSGRGGSSELGILPLLWGTLYISFVALCWWRCRSGSFSAIYLSEYADPPRPRRSPSRCSRSWRASPPSSTASSRC